MNFFHLAWIFVVLLLQVSGDTTDKCKARLGKGSWENDVDPDGSGTDTEVPRDIPNKFTILNENEDPQIGLTDDSIRIIFLIDESGSMKPRAATLITKFNELLNSQNSFKAKMPKLTFVKFYEKFDVKAYESIKKADLLTKDTYKPLGKTALHDALGCAINAYKDETHNIVMIITDGLDTASKIFTEASVAQVVTEIKSKKKWIVQYYGGNQKAKKEAKKLGINRRASYNWDAQSNKGVRKMMNKTNRKLTKAIKIQWNRIDKLTDEAGDSHTKVTTNHKKTSHKKRRCRHGKRGCKRRQRNGQGFNIFD